MFLAGIAGIAVTSGARANRDALMDAVAPVAAAAVPRIAPAGRPDEAAPKASAGAHEVQRHADGLFYVDATVNGRSLRFLVDTGASFVVLTEADARTVGAAPANAQYGQSVDTAGGSTAMAWTTLESVHLAGHEIRQVRAVVARKGLGVSLMGQNMLAELDSVTMSAGRLSLR